MWDLRLGELEEMITVEDALKVIEGVLADVREDITYELGTTNGMYYFKEAETRAYRELGRLL